MCSVSFYIRVVFLVTVVAAMVWWEPWRYVTQAWEVPPGFTLHRADDFRLSYPSGWQKREGKDGQGRPFVEFNGPADSQGAYSGRVRVVRQEPWPYRLEDKVAQLSAGARGSGHVITSVSPVLFEEARGAYRIEARHRTTTASGAAVWLRETEILALTEEGALLDFVVSAPERGDRQRRVPAIVASIRVEENDNAIVEFVKRGAENISRLG
jgi:hypothetical protein